MKRGFKMGSENRLWRPRLWPSVGLRGTNGVFGHGPMKAAWSGKVNPVKGTDLREF